MCWPSLQTRRGKNARLKDRRPETQGKDSERGHESMEGQRAGKKEMSEREGERDGERDGERER